MAKQSTVYVCQQCAFEAHKWLGKCPSCNSWNSFVEEYKAKAKPGQTAPSSDHKPVPLPQISTTSNERIITPDEEFNRVLGGGIVPGSLILIGGEPGIGKSTLMLQVATQFTTGNVLYISGEESGSQIRMRAERLNKLPDNCYILTETVTNQVIKQIKELQPSLVIVDSIQTMRNEYVESAPGSVSQIRETAADFMRLAKDEDIPIILIGHITKDGSLAGPKVLEHMVDTVLQFEGDKHNLYRILRTIKNRFGSTSEIGIYEMQGTGLRQVSNPSEILVSQHDGPVAGIAIGVTLEGMRPLLVETQALVSPAVYGTPQRTTTGYDAKRLNMLLAILEKKAGQRLGTQDVFVNITGGLKVDDTGIDLAIVAAIISSFTDIPLPAKATFAGELGLSGEIRPVNRIEQRIAEAEKLGYNEIFIAKGNYQKSIKSKISINPVSKIEELMGLLFG